MFEMIMTNRIAPPRSPLERGRKSSPSPFQGEGRGEALSSMRCSTVDNRQTARCAPHHHAGAVSGIMQRMASGQFGKTDAEYNNAAISHPLDVSDEALATRVALDNDTEAFAVLINRYRMRLLALSRRMLSAGDMHEEAEDIVQDSLVAAYKARAQYRRGEPYKAWIYRIVINRCVDRMRSRARKPQPVSFDAIVEPGTNTGPLEQLLTEERGTHMQAAIDKLPDKYRAVFLLRHLDDLSYEDIAAATDLPVGTVKTHLFRARAQLRESLKDVIGNQR